LLQTPLSTANITILLKFVLQKSKNIFVTRKQASARNGFSDVMSEYIESYKKQKNRGGKFSSVALCG
jgi:hypothetical protein